MARILVVDDRVENRDLHACLLGHFGHDVSTALDGAEAVRAALTGAPDLIMGIGMPDMDGYTAAGLMRSGPTLKAVPLIAVSATGSVTVKGSHAAGFDAFCPMPIDPRDFMTRLELFLWRLDAAGDGARRAVMPRAAGPGPDALPAVRRPGRA